MEDFTKYYKILILFAIGVIVIVVINSKGKGFDKVIETMKHDEYHGKIVDRFIDGKNHNQPTIILSNGRVITLYGHEYNKTAKGDSVSKEVNTTILKIFKKDGVEIIDRRIHVEYLKSKNK